MNRLVLKSGLAVGFAIACGWLFASHHADAQIPINPDSIAIIQNGHVVGELFRGATDPPSPDADPPSETDPPSPDTDPPSPDHYVEHWVLYPDYVYPSPRNGVVTQMTPGYHSYRDVRTFLAAVPFPKGSRYVKVDCADGTTIPGRK